MSRRGRVPRHGRSRTTAGTGGRRGSGGVPGPRSPGHLESGGQRPVGALLSAEILGRRGSPSAPGPLSARAAASAQNRHSPRSHSRQGRQVICSGTVLVDASGRRSPQPVPVVFGRSGATPSASVSSARIAWCPNPGSAVFSACVRGSFTTHRRPGRRPSAEPATSCRTGPTARRRPDPPPRPPSRGHRRCGSRSASGRAVYARHTLRSLVRAHGWSAGPSGPPGRMSPQALMTHRRGRRRQLWRR